MPTRAPKEPPAAAWWKAYLAEALSGPESVALAEAVLSVQEGHPLSAADEMKAEQAWGKVWAAACETDLRRLRAIFGPRAGWRQVCAA